MEQALYIIFLKVGGGGGVVVEGGEEVNCEH